MSIVCKFGGSSLCSENSFKKVKEIVKSNEKRKFIIASCVGKVETHLKTTDILINICKYKNCDNYFENEYVKMLKYNFKTICDKLVISLKIEQLINDILTNYEINNNDNYLISRGEYLTALILSKYLNYKFIDSTFIKLDNNNKVDLQKSKCNFFKVYKGEKIVIPGFYGSYYNGKIALFSRGGSDITGAIISNIANAELYENFTDVNGILCADPTIISKKNTIKYISYDKTAILCQNGAKVLHQDTTNFLKNKNIPIKIKNTFDFMGKYTLITNKDYISHTAISGFNDCIMLDILTTNINNKDIFDLLYRYNVKIINIFAQKNSLKIISNCNNLTINLNEIANAIKNISIVEKLQIKKVCHIAIVYNKKHYSKILKQLKAINCDTLIYNKEQIVYLISNDVNYTKIVCNIYNNLYN